MSILRSNSPKIAFSLIILIIISAFLIPQKAQAQHNDYPKLANYYLDWKLTDSVIAQLAKWDVVILAPQALEYNPQAIAKLKQINPNLLVLAYVPAQEITYKQDVLAGTKFWTKIYQAADQNNWWLKNASGQNVSYWAGNYLINASSSAPKANGESWVDYLPELVNLEFFQDSQWDGVFYDSVWQNISWINQPVDVNADGQNESNDIANARWNEGMAAIINKTRQLAPAKLIVVNSNSNYYNKNSNGRMIENFPADFEGGWAGSEKSYLNNNLGYFPKFFIINANSGNTGNSADYADFRFGLTSTLLGDGYYSYDSGDQGHNNAWWYDEYNLFLGKALSANQNLLDKNSQEIKPGVWSRDFQNAKVIVNSTSVVQTITLDQEYEKIKGTQDPQTNSGSVVKTLTINPNDGIILLRRLENVQNSPYFNGSFVRAFDKAGTAVRNGFFIYDKNYRGGQMIDKQDVNSDNEPETIVADSGKITIYKKDQNILSSFYPYGKAYSKGLNFAVSDFDNDGNLEIVTGTQKGGSSLVKVFSYLGQAQGDGFYAYNKNFYGGVNVAVCDTKGNGQKQIVTGSGFMGGPQVRIFDKNGKVLSGGFFAYGKDFRGGVYVACGDIDANGIDEIITGAGFGGSSHVRIFNGQFKALSPGFFAFGQTSRTGVKVLTADLDNDGKKEILAASPDVFTTSMQPSSNLTESLIK